MAKNSLPPSPDNVVLGDFDLAGMDASLGEDLDDELAELAELAVEGTDADGASPASPASPSEPPLSAAAVVTPPASGSAAAAAGGTSSPNGRPAGVGKGGILSAGPALGGAGAAGVGLRDDASTGGGTPRSPPSAAGAAVAAAVGAVKVNGEARESNGSQGTHSSGGRKSSGSRKVGKRQGGSTHKSGGRSNASSRSEDGTFNNDRDEHPWKVGSTLEVITWNGRDRKFCDIIETATISSMKNDPDPSKRTKYYVHYHGLNRRMDEWVSADRVTKPPSVAKAEAKAQKEETERARRELERENSTDIDLGIRTRRQKRKATDIVENEEGEEVGAAVGAPGASGGVAGVGAGAVGVGGVGLLVGQGMHMDDDHDEHHGLDEASLKEHEEVTKVKNVNGVELGRYRMECWYFSPFPKEFYPDGYVDTLYFCEYTLRYFRHKKELLRFQRRQKPPRHPPGNEIYRSGNLAMFEVDGGEQKEYGQNLCSLAKLFLDHKTLYYDVDPFLFYVMCEVDSFGFHPVGYFSKEKYSDLGYNLACILTFPSYQRKGYGRFLIAFSYELSKKEEKVGSPEKPLSDLGAAAYRSYWASVIIQAMQSFQARPALAIVDISKVTSIISDDVIDTMTRLGLLKYSDGDHQIVATPALLSSLAEKYPVKEPCVDSNKVHWTPLVDSAHIRDKFFIRNKIAPKAEPVEMEEE
ncbi:unnamed protein product [Ascophyllum nodosum]